MSGFFSTSHSLLLYPCICLKKKKKKEEKKEKNKSTSGSKSLFQDLNKEEMLIDMYNQKR